MLNFASLLLDKLRGKKGITDKRAAEIIEHQTAMSAEAVKSLVNQNYRPRMYDVLRALSTGKYKKQGYRRGFPYKGNKTSEARKQRRLRQIEKGMIQVSPEYMPKNKQQEVGNAGNSEMVRF